MSVITALSCSPVPPHTPSCEIPSGAVTGSVVQLRCRDHQSIPPATYSWFKDSQPISPSRHANATYVINQNTGILVSVFPQDKETVFTLSPCRGDRLVEPYSRWFDNGYRFWVLLKDALAEQMLQILSTVFFFFFFDRISIKVFPLPFSISTSGV